MVAMALRAPFTELFSLRHPIALAPMGGPAGARWRRPSPTAVAWGWSAAAGGNPGWLDRALPIVAAGTGGLAAQAEQAMAPSGT